jgi:hypothetical protein
VSDPAIPFPLQRASWPAASLSSYSSICALNIMTNNERTQTAIGNQDNRILNGYAWFPSPRQEKTKELSGRKKKDLRRIRHGSVRAIEDLRGVRLPLVSCPGPGYGLLQGMRSEVGGLSGAGNPKAAREAIR